MTGDERDSADGNDIHVLFVLKTLETLLAGRVQLLDAEELGLRLHCKRNGKINLIWTPSAK